MISPSSFTLRNGRVLKPAAVEKTKIHPAFRADKSSVQRTVREQVASVFSAPRMLKIGVTTSSIAGDDQSGNRGKKGVVTGFSAAARSNLARCLAQISSPHPLSHVTLTYRDMFPCSGEALAKEKQALCMAAQRCGLYGVWRLEFHRSTENTEWGMVPHWHCLLYSGTEKTAYLTQSAPTGHGTMSAEVNKGVADFVAWFRRNRNAHVRGSHITNGDEASASWYMAYHAVKLDQSPPFKVGKWWGYVQEPQLKKWSRLDEVAQGVSPAEIIWFKRLWRRKTNAERRAKGLSPVRASLGSSTGISWFLNQGDHAPLLHLVDGLGRMTRDQRLSA